jgi:hypothetical protein
VGLPTTFAPPEDLSRATVAARRTIVFSENDAADKFSINGKQFDPNRVDIQSKLNNPVPSRRACSTMRAVTPAMPRQRWT